MNVESYLFFAGNCEEALEYYRKALGAKIEMMMRFSDSPDKHDPYMVPPEWESKVMHSTLTIGDTKLMASDGHANQKASFTGFGLSLNLSSAADADRYFAALSDGGQVRMPLAKTFFSPRFGMVVDRFGVLWMIHVYQ